MPGVAVIAKVPAAPGKREALASALQLALDNVVTEPGTRYYLLHADRQDENLLWMYELYEDQAALDDELTTITADGPTLEQAVGDTAAALAAAEAAIDAELAELATTRDAVRGQIDATLIARYDRLRSQLGVAVARLVGNRCDGCHLDLSAAEAEQVRAVPADQAADCPNCGRLLIR